GLSYLALARSHGYNVLYPGNGIPLDRVHLGRGWGVDLQVHLDLRLFVDLTVDDLQYFHLGLFSGLEAGVPDGHIHLDLIPEDLYIGHRPAFDQVLAFTGRRDFFQGLENVRFYQLHTTVFIRSRPARSEITKIVPSL